MDTSNPSFLKQLGLMWSKLGPNQQLLIIVLALVLFIAFGIWLGVARQPAYALLYGDLDPVDAGRIISELQSRDVPYKLREGGRSIHVPANRVDELRISLATSGFAPVGPSGYEILDKNQLGVSDLNQRTNRIRAIEGELARTLMSLDEVSAARVHLTMPEPTPFIAEQEEPAASVVLQLTPPGITLSRARIAAVRTFVAGAIGTKNLDNVTIIDQNMNLLTGPTFSEPGALLPSQEEARRAYEIQRAADIRSLLERAYGIGKVAVSFSCEMNFDQVQTEKTTAEPVPGTDHGVLVSEEFTSTSSSGAQSPGGVPGIESNIPGYPAASGQPIKSESTSEVKNYQVSQTRETRIQAPGTVTRCSVGVIIDSTGREILPSDKREAEELIAAAAGVNPAAGDVVTVAFRPFDTSLQEELEKGKMLAGAARGPNWLSWIVAIAAVAIFFIVLANFLKPIEKPLIIPAAEEIEEPIPSVELPPTDPAVLEKLRQREEIERLIREDPAAAAKVIKTWLQE